jgi:hypothetical protein
MEDMDVTPVSQIMSKRKDERCQEVSVIHLFGCEV